MADHSPTEVARLLGVKDATLRVWAKEYAALLSPSAAVSGPKVRRRYQESDIAQLRTIQALLRTGATHEQVQAQLGAGLSTIVDTESDSPIGESLRNSANADNSHSVVVLDQQPEVAALRQLLAMQGATLEAQRATLEAQAQLIGQLQQQGVLDREALERARGDEQRATEELEYVLRKIPRWLRALLGLGV